MDTATAQEAYANLVKRHLSPAFRDRGWKGSGGRYQFPSDTHWIQAGLQSSSWNDRDHVRFTMNLGIVSRAGWAEMVTAGRASHDAPNANVHFGAPADGARLGGLASDTSRDEWFEVTPKTDLVELAKKVMDDFDRFAQPWFAEREV